MHIGIAFALRWRSGAVSNCSVSQTWSINDLFALRTSLSVSMRVYCPAATFILRYPCKPVPRFYSDHKTHRSNNASLFNPEPL